MDACLRILAFVQREVVVKDDPAKIVFLVK